MKIVLTKQNDVVDYHNWLKKTIMTLNVSDMISSKLLEQLLDRDRLGSVQIAEHVVMPHVVSDQLPESWIIVSQLDKPIIYNNVRGITTGIYIFSLPNDSRVSDVVERLADESVVDSLQDSQLSQQQLEKILVR